MTTACNKTARQQLATTMDNHLVKHNWHHQSHNILYHYLAAAVHHQNLRTKHWTSQKILNHQGLRLHQALASQCPMTVTTSPT